MSLSRTLGVLSVLVLSLASTLARADESAALTTTSALAPSAERVRRLARLAGVLDTARRATLADRLATESTP